MQNFQRGGEEENSRLKNSNISGFYKTITFQTILYEIKKKECSWKIQPKFSFFKSYRFII